MRILFISNSLRRHVYTLLRLAIAAQETGHDVVFATGADLAPAVEDRGIFAWAVGLDHLQLCAVPNSWFGYFELAAERRAHQVITRARAWKPDLVVHEETELSGVLVAAVTGARQVVHGVGPMPSRKVRDLLSQAGERLGRRWLRQPLAPAPFEEAAYLHICPPSLRSEEPRKWQRAYSIKPAMGMAAPGEHLPFAIEELPHRDTLHLTMRTGFHRNVAALRTAVAGLRNLPLNVVVTTGPASDPSILGPQPPNVLVAPHVRHSLLLPHCTAVISQGGAGVLLGGLAHGLPQMVLPQGGDEFGNGEACVRSGAGLSLRPEETTAERIRDGVVQLLQEPAFRARACAIAAEIAAMPGPGEVVKYLAAFATSDAVRSAA